MKLTFVEVYVNNLFNNVQEKTATQRYHNFAKLTIFNENMQCSYIAMTILKRLFLKVC